MPGGNTSSQQQQQNSISSPWAPSQPMLQNILGQLGGQSTGVTPGQSGAVGALQTAANSIPNFGGAGSDAVSKALGTNTNPQQGMLGGALDTMRTNLTPYASGANLNPMNTPGFSDALKTMNTDITNQVNGQFAAAGRDLSPANSTALARGLSQGEGGLLANQFNQNVGTMMGANQSLFGGAGSTAGGLTAQQLAQLQGQGQGISEAGAIPGLTMAPGQAQLGAANTAQGLPFQNIGMLEGLVNPIAGLGGQSSGTATGTTTQQQSPFSNVIGGLLGGAGILGGTGAFGKSGWLNFGQ